MTRTALSKQSKEGRDGSGESTVVLILHPHTVKIARQLVGWLTGAAAEVEDSEGLVKGLQHVPGALRRRARRVCGMG